MSNVIFDISTSLDGFITAAGQTPEEPLGSGGERLHEWAFGDDEQSREVLRSAVDALGAVIAGRKTYDDSMPGWGADGPTGPARVRTFVVTHEAPAESPEGGVYEFITGGIHEALERARAEAGDRRVGLMGGANLAAQYLEAGLVDEVSLHVVPVLFGAGTPLFEGVSGRHIQLEALEVIETEAATHVRYRVVKQGQGGAPDAPG